MKDYYVYALIDPRDGIIFYVGKGRKKRYQSHIQRCRKDMGNLDKSGLILEILNAGLKVKIEFLYRNLSENEAFRREYETIKSIGLNNLTNIAPGFITPGQKALQFLKRMVPFHIWINLKSPFTGKSWSDIELHSWTICRNGWENLARREGLIS